LDVSAECPENVVPLKGWTPVIAALLLILTTLLLIPFSSMKAGHTSISKY
jgi:hypothetical protein